MVALSFFVAFWAQAELAMTLTVEGEGPVRLLPPGKRKAPEISLEWKDMHIEIRYCGGEEEEAGEYVELWPRVSDKLVSTACLQEGREKRSRREARERSEEGDQVGEGAHTLAQLLRQNQDVNCRSREGSTAGSSTVSSQQDEEDKDLPESHDDIKMSKLIELSSGSKGCHICGKVFGDSTRIKRHLLSHSKEKPFKCHKCGWGFHQKCNMERHLASHTREGEGHACPSCDSWFTTKSVLSLHLRDAHNERYIGKKDLLAGGGVKKERPAVVVKQQEEAEENDVKEIMEVKEVKVMKQVEEGKEEDMGLMQHSIFSQPELKHEGVKHEEVKYEPMEITFPKALPLSLPKLPGIRKGTFGPNEGSSTPGILSDELTCHLCLKTFVKKTNLKHHLMLHRGEKPWKCHICAYRFVQKCNLKKHIETHQTGTYKCPHCTIMFASKGAVAGHMTIVHLGMEDDSPGATLLEEEDEEAEIPAPPEKPVPEVVKKTASPAMTWWKHLSPPADDSPKTSEAGAETETTAATANTSSGETPKKQPTPAVSVKPAKTTVNIAPKAVPSPTKQPETKALACSKCTKTFPAKADLDKHMMVHNATTKPYACPVCGWRFHLIHNMKRHLTTHEESGDIEVGTADELLAAVEATATRPASLTSPRPSSSLTSPRAPVSPSLPTSVDGMVSPSSAASSEAGQDPGLRCNICNKWFTETVALSRHMEVHSADRPFACSICGWRFKQVQNMKRHMLTHSGAKPYTCDFCDKSYTDNYSLKQHVSKVHPEVASSIPNMLGSPGRTKKSGPNAREVSQAKLVYKPLYQAR